MKLLLRIMAVLTLGFVLSGCGGLPQGSDENTDPSADADVGADAGDMDPNLSP